MGTETHTGKLIFGEAQVDMDDGTVLAVADSPTPCAAALARYEKWGQTDPVTVTGTTGKVNNSPVLFVTTIDWAEPAPALALAAGGDVPPTKPKAAPPKKAAKKKAAKKKAAKKAARSGSKQ